MKYVVCACLTLILFPYGIFSESTILTVTVIGTPACADGLDNDSDTYIDYPLDPGCLSALDTNETDPVATSGGGGGGGSSSEIISTSISILGRAYPLSKVTVLKDGQVAASTIAGPDSKFEVSLTGISSGNYLISMYTEDAKKNRSDLFNFPVTVTRGSNSKVSGVFISPTISVDKTQVKKGDPIIIFGQTAPLAVTNISIHSEEEFQRQVTADNTGAYLLNFNSGVLSYGQHETYVRAWLQNEFSSVSKKVGFEVGLQNVLKTNTEISARDLNDDTKINLVDFSIMAYWKGRSLPPKKVDLNGDGVVNLKDFSILAYHWTG